LPHIDFIGPDGTAWPSATQLTNLLPQPWLWSWYKSQVKAHGWRGWLKCLATSKRGMKIGSEVHALIEGFIAKQPVEVPGKYDSQSYADALFDIVNPLVKRWVAIEPHLQSVSYKLHGTADAIVDVDEGLTVLDWKTSASKSDTHPIQLAIYALAWNEMHPNQLITRGVIARVDKKSKRLGVKLDVYENLEQYYKIVLALRTIWSYTNEER
jgi:hypothetical protein